jgi:glucan-binding YG repeat protein
MISVGAGIIFKGSGFWETDYNRSADYQKKSKDEAGEARSNDGVSQPKTQSEPKKADAPAPTPASPASTTVSKSTKPSDTVTSGGGNGSASSTKQARSTAKPPTPPKR